MSSWQKTKQLNCLFCSCLNLPPTSLCSSVPLSLYFICLNDSRPSGSVRGMDRQGPGSTHGGDGWHRNPVTSSPQPSVRNRQYLLLLVSPLLGAHVALFRLTFSFINSALHAWSFHTVPKSEYRECLQLALVLLAGSQEVSHTVNSSLSPSCSLLSCPGTCGHHFLCYVSSDNKVMKWMATNWNKLIPNSESLL